MERQPLCREAAGQWHGLLAIAGLDQHTLSGQHCPCPMCGGTDRFRFDDREGLGTWICSRCGAGDGPALLMRVVGLDFKGAAEFVRENCGSVVAEKPKPTMTEQDRRRGLRDLWRTSKPIQKGDLVDIYLRDRGIDLPKFPQDLRFAPRAACTGVVKERPAMLALLRDQAATPITIHRTYLADDGIGKADMDAPRKLMPGQIPEGVCVRLGSSREHIGIAEGIETALAAMLLQRPEHRFPVWSAVNAMLLEKWLPPDGVKRVTIFADNDKSFTGHKASGILAYRLATKEIEVDVRMPLRAGTDWNDVLLGADNG